MNGAWRESGLACRVVGGLLLAQWSGVVCIKAAQGRAVELLWLSHVALLLTGVAFLTRSDRLLRVVFCAIAVPHAFWLADAAGVLLVGVSPMGVTQYLTAATPADWLATAHHFVMLPLLVAALWRRPGGRSGVLAEAWGVCVAVTLAARFLGGPASNVNYSYALLAGIDHPLLRALNAAHPSAYLLCLMGVLLVGVALPGVCLCRWITGEAGTGSGTGTRRHALARA